MLVRRCCEVNEGLRIIRDWCELNDTSVDYIRVQGIIVKVFYPMHMTLYRYIYMYGIHSTGPYFKGYFYLATTFRWPGFNTIVQTVIAIQGILGFMILCK